MHIDSSIVELFTDNIPVYDINKSNTKIVLINLLDCYLGATDQSLKHLGLSRKTVNKIFTGFVGALNSDSFIVIKTVTRKGYVRAFCSALETLSKEIPSLTYEIDDNMAEKEWNSLKICQSKREYYLGWPVTGKLGSDRKSLNLAWIWNNLGKAVAKSIHKSASEFVRRYRDKSLGNFTPILNELLIYIEINYPQLDSSEFKKPLFTTELIEGFCRSYFNDKAERSLCIDTSIKRWNDSVEFLVYTLIESKVLASPYRRFPYIPPKHKAGSETKIVKNKDGVIVKDNLIRDIPINITDDEAIELLFSSINEDMNMVVEWAQRQVDQIYSKYVNNAYKFNYMDFDLPSKGINSKYKINPKKKERLDNFAQYLGLPTSYSLEPFMYLLVYEHPKIISSLLLNLTLFDEQDQLIGIETTDAGEYLIGYKHRSGATNSQKKILLNNRSKALVEKIIQITTPLRNYLKVKGDKDYRYLFLDCRTGFARPQKTNCILRNSRISKSLITRSSQFNIIKKDWNQEQALNFVSGLSLSKFRATCGVQVFIKTGSTSEMSKALGHKEYKPNLLSHYLPEPILQFFQSRWIRIFQKGIICEAMKDSSFLLRASNFKTMKELDGFLSKHALNLPADSDEQDIENRGGSEQSYISIDENSLIALLSLELAVKLADKKVSPKALYWSKFTSLLKIEIEKNSYDSEMISSLNQAKIKVNPSLMKEVIYV